MAKAGFNLSGNTNIIGVKASEYDTIIGETQMPKNMKHLNIGIKIEMIQFLVQSSLEEVLYKSLT